MLACKSSAIKVFAGGSLIFAAHADVVLRPIPEQKYGGPAMGTPGSIDACSGDMLVAAFDNGFIYRIDLRTAPPTYLKVAGDTASLLKRELWGSTVKCLDSNTLYLRDTWSLYRIRLDAGAIDTLEPVLRDIVYNLVNDTLKNHYVVAGQRIYKVGDTLREIAKAPAGLWNMAIRDSNEFMGVGEKHMYHFQDGRMDSIASPRGYQWFSCVWIRDRYLVRDRGTVSQAYAYDPVRKALRKLETDPGFNQTAWGSYELAYTRFEDKELVVSDGNLFLVNDSAVIPVAVRHEGGTGPIEDATYSATLPKFGDAYVLSGGRIGKIISAIAVPVSVMPILRSPPSSNPGKRGLSGYRIDGVSLPGGG